MSNRRGRKCEATVGEKVGEGEGGREGGGGGWACGQGQGQEQEQEQKQKDECRGRLQRSFACHVRTIQYSTVL